MSDTGTLRYGVSLDEKERLAREGSLPGAPIDNTAEQEAADRYAAGYLFAQTWPRLAPVVMPIINALKTSDLPLLGGDDPSLQSQAQAGVNRSLIDQANIYTTPVNTSARPWDDPAFQAAKRRPAAADQSKALKK
jgi:hypothetical protein